MKIQPVPQKRSDANGEDYFELKQELDRESERVGLVEQKLRNVGRWPESNGGLGRIKLVGGCFGAYFWACLARTNTRLCIPVTERRLVNCDKI